MTTPPPLPSTPGAESSRRLQTLGPIGFVGAGAVGGALARALAARGARVVAITAAHAPSAAAVAADIPGCQPLPDVAAVVAASTLVFLAVPDDALAPLDAALRWQPAQTVVHLSGARGAAALPHASAAGAGVAALHPLMLFPRPPLAGPAALARLAGCTWSLTTDDAVVASRLESLVTALAGHLVRLAEDDRVPYHIAAVLASNYVVVLLGAAMGIWERFGIAPRPALDALLPLVRASVDNLATLGPVQALTGPVARGDATTIAAHLDWLAANATAAPPSEPAASAGQAAGGGDPLRAAYIALAQLAIPLALARGTLSEPAAEALRTLLREADA